MHLRAITAILLLGIMLTGCAVPSNPSFPLTRSQARLDLDAMARNPKRAVRPVLFLGAYMDVGYASAELRTQLSRVISDGRFLTVTFIDCTSFDECRRRVIEKVDREFPSRDRLRTVEVDAVGLSMGGLVGRYAAQPGLSDKQLRVARLFTIATPHRGAMLGTNMYIDPLARQMRSGSSFIQQLNRTANQGSYQLIPYVWTNDNIVGAGNAAPPGKTPWWLPPVAFLAPHVGPMYDPRAIADIARRLRGEKPYTVEPPAPLPPGATAVSTPTAS